MKLIKKKIAFFIILAICFPICLFSQEYKKLIQPARERVLQEGTEVEYYSYTKKAKYKAFVFCTEESGVWVYCILPSGESVDAIIYGRTFNDSLYESKMLRVIISSNGNWHNELYYYDKNAQMHQIQTTPAELNEMFSSFIYLKKMSTSKAFAKKILKSSLEGGLLDQY